MTVRAAVQLVLTYVPVTNGLLRTAPIGPGAWVRILLACLASLVAAGKRLHRRAP